MLDPTKWCVCYSSPHCLPPSVNIRFQLYDQPDAMYIVAYDELSGGPAQVLKVVKVIQKREVRCVVWKVQIEDDV